MLTLESPGKNDSATEPGDLPAALEAWSQVIGREFVDATAETCQRYGRSTSPWNQEPVAVLRPRTVAEVQEIVRIAGRYRCPLYPISGGKNWGLGDACPTSAGQVVLDLGRLNAIREVNSELCYAVIEAGVTQRQLYDYLAEHAPTLAFDATGAGPNATIVGNIMERGYGHSPYGDRFHHSCNYEVVLANGELLRTGFGAFPGAKSANVMKTGLGPALDGLFTQSNFGVVTSMTVWLMPKPRCSEAFAFKVDDDELLPQIIDALRPLRLNGVLSSTIHIANDLRLIASKMTYPWHLTGGVTPLPDAVRASLRKAYGIGAWNVLGGLYGTSAMVSGARRELRGVLRGLAQPRFINDRRLALARRLVRISQFVGIGKSFANQLESIEPAFSMLKGEPVADHLRSTAWRTPHPNEESNTDPLERGDGLIWLSPTIPMTGLDVSHVWQISKSIYAKHGFELMLTFVSISGRAMCSPMTICYDKLSSLERRRASDCYRELAQSMTSHGYFPYRLGIQSMSSVLDDTRVDYSLKKIKQVLDPNRTIAPQRYERSCG